MKTSMGLLVRTPEAILQETAANSEVLNGFDELDRIKAATAKSCKCMLIDDTKKGEWRVKVVFDWRTEQSADSALTGDMEVIVIWRRGPNGIHYEIESCEIIDSGD